jgi:hypothetical protein
VNKLNLFLAGIVLFVAGVLAQGKTATQANPGFNTLVRPALKQYCLSCHSGASPAAGVDFTKFGSDASVRQSPDIWTQAARYLASNHMPPEGNPQPSAALRQKLVNWIQKALSSDCGLRDPGEVTIHRLDRAEYRNTIRDLLGVDFKGTDDFPSDDVGYGFDNISDLLSISPLLMEKYLTAAEQVAAQAVVLREGKSAVIDPSHIHYPPNKFASLREDDLVIYSNGMVTAVPEFEKGGHYLVRVPAYGDQAGPEPCKMDVTFDGQTLGTVLVQGHSREESIDFDFPLVSRAGKHTIGVAFTNDYYNPTDPDPKNRDRNLIIEGIEIIGPELLDDQLPPAQARIIPTEPNRGHQLSAAKAIFAKLASRAYRRPATPEEVARLASYVSLALKNGDSFERGIQLGIEAMLVSPNFLFRSESDPASTAPNSIRMLSGYEMASRLSYFLWSSMPDDTLFRLAATGSLQKPAVLEAQVQRMLKDPKAMALTDNFAGQWLTLSKLNIVTPDKHLFPDFNDAMRHDMATETKDFFAYIVNNDRSVLDFLDAKYSFVNERLAHLYGIPSVEGEGFRKISLEGTEREGVLTQASVLTATSNPTRTSPVKRGKWVLEQILGTPPPPPPPGVGVLKDENNPAVSVSLRKMMEAHRANPTCAACHARMDPLGFGFENFDGIGKWRTSDGKFDIDPSGELPGGIKFAGPSGLIKILLTRKDLFVRCLGEKLLTYALGRGLSISDQCVLDDLGKKAKADGYRFSSLITAIVLSDPFRKRHCRIISQ